MKLKALKPITLSPEKKVRVGETFEASDQLGAKYLRMQMAEPADAKATAAAKRVDEKA